MRSTHGIRALLAACTIASAAGCAASRGAAVNYHDPNMDFSLIQTVAVLPFENLSSSERAGDAVRDVFMTMLQATGTIYVLPPGEVGRGIDRAALDDPRKPSAEKIVQLGSILSADVVITGTVREYGELRSGGSAAGVVSMSVQMHEAQTGRMVWSASTSEGGVSAGDRVFGGGGRPMDDVTRQAVADLLDKLFG